MDAPPEIQRLGRLIAEAFHPERIVLFGSRARGGAGVVAGADVDLLVLMEFEGSAIAAAGRIRAMLPADIAVDVVVRRPQEYRLRLDGGDPFAREVDATGIVLYSAA